jgi:hypothetical protein
MPLQQFVSRAATIMQLTIATAIVFFHRFFARQSFRKYDRIVRARASPGDGRVQ